MYSLVVFGLKYEVSISVDLPPELWGAEAITLSDGVMASLVHLSMRSVIRRGEIERCSSDVMVDMCESMCSRM